MQWEDLGAEVRVLRLRESNPRPGPGPSTWERRRPYLPRGVATAGQERQRMAMGG